jgi:hypothetical protein
METRVLQLARAGADDAEIARQLTAEGHRSPSRTEVLCSTVQGIRLRHRFKDAARTNPLGKNTGPAMRAMAPVRNCRSALIVLSVSGNKKRPASGSRSIRMTPRRMRPLTQLTETPGSVATSGTLSDLTQKSP